MATAKQIRTRRTEIKTFEYTQNVSYVRKYTYAYTKMCKRKKLRISISRDLYPAFIYTNIYMIK